MFTYQGEHLAGPFPAMRMDPIPTPISRPTLINFLYEVVTSLGISITFGQRAAEYYEDRERSKAGIVTTSGIRHEADVVVAADGIGSKSSSLISTKNSEPKSSGFAVYRTAFPTQVAHISREVARDYPVLPDGNDDVRVYLGPDTHAITLVSKTITTWLLTHRVGTTIFVFLEKQDLVSNKYSFLQDRGDSAESWSTTVSSEDVINEITKDVPWDPRLLRLIKQTPARSIIDWRLMWRDPRQAWSSPAGLITQIGDAAHSFLPSSANGGTQSIEDGISLAACLQIAGKDRIPLAAKVHFQLR